MQHHDRMWVSFFTLFVNLSCRLADVIVLSNKPHAVIIIMNNANHWLQKCAEKSIIAVEKCGIYLFAFACF